MHDENGQVTHDLKSCMVDSQLVVSSTTVFVLCSLVPPPHLNIQGFSNEFEQSDCDRSLYIRLRKLLIQVFSHELFTK